MSPFSELGPCSRILVCLSEFNNQNSPSVNHLFLSFAFCILYALDF